MLYNVSYFNTLKSRADEKVKVIKAICRTIILTLRMEYERHDGIYALIQFLRTIILWLFMTEYSSEDFVSSAIAIDSFLCLIEVMTKQTIYKSQWHYRVLIYIILWCGRQTIEFILWFKIPRFLFPIIIAPVIIDEVILKNYKIRRTVEQWILSYLNMIMIFISTKFANWISFHTTGIDPHITTNEIKPVFKYMGTCLQLVAVTIGVYLLEKSNYIWAPWLIRILISQGYVLRKTLGDVSIKDPLYTMNDVDARRYINNALQYDHRVLINPHIQLRMLTIYDRYPVINEIKKIFKKCANIIARCSALSTVLFTFSNPMFVPICSIIMNRGIRQKFATHKYWWVLSTILSIYACLHIDYMWIMGIVIVMLEICPLLNEIIEYTAKYIYTYTQTWRNALYSRILWARIIGVLIITFMNYIGYHISCCIIGILIYKKEKQYIQTYRLRLYISQLTISIYMLIGWLSDYDLWHLIGLSLAICVGIIWTSGPSVIRRIIDDYDDSIRCGGQSQPRTKEIEDDFILV